MIYTTYLIIIKYYISYLININYLPTLPSYIFVPILFPTFMIWEHWEQSWEQPKHLYIKGFWDLFPMFPTDLQKKHRYVFLLYIAFGRKKRLPFDSLTIKGRDTL